MNAIEMLNEPIKFPVAGRTMGFRRLSSIRQISISESYILEQRIKKIKAAYSVLSESDPTYPERAVGELKDEEIHSDAINLCPPPELVCRMIAMACDAPISQGDVELLFDLAEEGEMKAVMSHVFGAKKKS